MGAVGPPWGWAGSAVVGWEWPKASPACDRLGWVRDDVYSLETDLLGVGNECSHHAKRGLGGVELFGVGIQCRFLHLTEYESHNMFHELKKNEADIETVLKCSTHSVMPSDLSDVSDLLSSLPGVLAGWGVSTNCPSAAEFCMAD